MLAIYCRTSNSKIGKNDYSIENQQDGGIRLANQLGVESKTYIDEGISGTIRERESFMQMMEHIQGKDKKIKLTGVYCIDQSRIERDSDIWRFFSAECILNKVKFYPNGNELDLNDITSKLFADLISLVNEYYAALTSKKVKLANAKKTLEGKTHGQIAYGYGRDSQNNYIINNEEADVVKKIFDWKIEGLGNYIICNKLNEQKIRTKQNKKWRGVTIDGIIKNKLYKGIREWNRDDIDNFVEFKLDNFIIDSELWDKANITYKANIKKAGKKQQFNYLLDEALFCGKCGQKYFGKKRLKGADSSYKCRGLVKFASQECRENRGVNIEKMDTFIIQHLFKSKSLKELLINAPKNAGEVSILKNELEKITGRKDIELRNKNRLYRLISNPDLEYDEQIIKDYTKSKNRLEKSINEINQLTQKIAEVSNNQRNQKAENLIESYTEDINFLELKKIINSLIERIEVVYDRKPTSHGGNFIFRIKYRNYDETSTFTAKSTLFDFNWILNYRAQATNQLQLEEDRKIIINRTGLNNKEKYQSFIDKWNKLERDGLISKIDGGSYLDQDSKNPYNENFIGTVNLTYMNETINFSRNELINLNQTP